MYRQGDILIVKVNELPNETMKPLDHKIVAHGELTGHAHKLEGNAKIYDALSGMYLSIVERSSLVHDEHDTIEIPEGIYRVIRQREYDEGKIRRVTD